MRQPISEVYNEDCMAGMARYPDGYFHLAVVDPPYGLGTKTMQGGGYAKKWRNLGSRFSAAEGYNYKQWDASPPDDLYFLELFRVSKAQIIWGANYFNLPPCRCNIVWDKQQPCRNFADFELAWTSFDKPAAMFRNANHGIFRDSKTIHPTQKPIALYKWLLTNYAKPGDRILDTHLGSGSSRIAAWDMGFDFYGWELDADYFAAMQKRFETHTSKPVLFSPEEMYTFEQTKLFPE